MPIHRVKGGWKWGSRGKVYKSRAGAERQARAAYANGYRGDAKRRLRMAQERRDSAEQGPFILPPDHKPGMRVSQGGSSCASCQYLGPDGETCINTYFIMWHGSERLPAPADEYCSDWYEPAR